MKTTIVLLGLLLAGPAFATKFPKLAKTPPMGWNSWNAFACDVDELKVKAAADAMVQSGMQQAGYEFVVIDDCWQGQRDQDGFIVPDRQRFPSGMKALADYVHQKHLKFGIYSDAGFKTCGGRPGSRGYEYQDALSYARWGVDYLKYDWCNTEALNAEGAFLTMREALFAAKRPVVFSICEWGNNKPWEWGKDVGHLWRTTGDITHCFDCIVDHGTWKSWGILQIVEKQAGLREHAAPGHWNDPDMMEVGNGMTVAEDRAHFSLWAMLAAPLIAGNDLVQMSTTTRAILTNREVIAVDQDRLGIQGFRYLGDGPLEVWARPLAGAELALLFLNRGDAALKLNFRWEEHMLKDDLTKKYFDFKRQRYTVRDLWSQKNVGSTADALDTTIPSHDVLMLRLKPTRR